MPHRVHRIERLRLVPIGARHAPELRELHQDGGIARWYPLSREQALRGSPTERRARGGITGSASGWPARRRPARSSGGPSWAVVEGAERTEIGWKFRRTVWGRAYATEIGRFGLDHAFSAPGVEEVVSFTEVHELATLGELGVDQRRPPTLIPLSAVADHEVPAGVAREKPPPFFADRPRRLACVAADER